MKKLMFISVAFAAMSFVSCGNKSAANAEGADSAAQEEVEVATADELVSSLDEAVAAGEVEGTETAVANFNESIQKLADAGKTVEAQELIEKLKAYIADNKAAITAVVPSLVEKVEALPTDVNEAVTALGESVKANAAEKANEIVEGVENKAQEQIDAAKAKAQEEVDAAKAKVQEKVDETKAKAQEQVKATQDKAKEKANEAINNAAKDLKKGLGL